MHHLLASSTNLSGPQIRVTGWVMWVIIIGAVIAALATIATAITKFVLPVVRMAVKFEEEWPILAEIADDFKPNGGDSLRDRIDKIDRTQDAIELLANERVKALEVDVEALKNAKK
jgi:hypothetical protein